MNINRHNSNRGSVILTVVIVTTFLLAICASLLSYSLTERKINRATQLRFQSKNAAEAVLEYAASEVSARLNNNYNFSSDEFENSPTLTFSNRGGNLFPTAASEYNYVDPAQNVLMASLISSGTKRYIDPNNPGNDFDPLRGQWVNSRTIRFLAKAEAVDGSGRAATSYATQTIEIRDAALFNYAIFYNLRMEFHPSPPMTIVGPVHSNKNAYLTEGSSLKFLGAFTTAGQLTVGGYTNGRPSGRDISFSTGVDEDGDGANDTETVNYPTIEGKGIGTYVDSQIESRDDKYNFRDLASQIWNGYVQDASHGITEQTPPGVITGALAHDLIEAPDTSSSANASIEAQKFSAKAGLYLVTDSTGKVTAFYTAADATNFKIASNRTNWATTNLDKIVTLPSGTVKTNRRVYDHREGKWINTVDIDVGRIREAVNQTDTNSDGSVDSMKINGTNWDIDNTNSSDGVSGKWNGIVYVDVESPTTGYSSTSDIGSVGTGSGTRTSVRLLNGGTIPDRSATNPANSTLPEGMTLATNAPVYVVGNYNADGNLSTGSLNEPEGGNEAPAAIVADAINVLSSSWVDSSGKPIGDNTSSSSSRPSAGNTEVSAAFLTGIVSSSSGNNSDYSGGVENYPRFHENWGGKSLRYRGSIVALFESEIATGKWSSAKYGAPKREWGFNSMFGNGKYPPGTPFVRTYRRIDYRDIGLEEYNAYAADSNFKFTRMEAPSLATAGTDGTSGSDSSGGTTVTDSSGTTTTTPDSSWGDYISSKKKKNK